MGALRSSFVLMGVGLAVITFGQGCLAPAAADQTGPSWHLTVQGGRMTARVQDAPLEMILREISRRLPLTVSIQGPAARDLVTVRFRNLPVEDGIRKVLEGKEYAIIHARPASPDMRHAGWSSVREILVFSGPGSGAPEEDRWMKLGGAAEGRTAPAPRAVDEEPRAHAQTLRLEEMAELSDGEELLPALVRALDDKDLSVRAKALDVLEDTLGPIPFQQLAHMAEAERDPLMRSRALMLLAFRAEERAVQPLTRALQDPDADVRRMASDLLAQLGVTSPAPPAPRQDLP